MMRITTSSRNPMTGVFATASIWPIAARRLRRAFIDHQPFALRDEPPGDVVGALAGTSSSTGSISG